MIFYKKQDNMSVQNNFEIACSNGDLQVVKYLVENKADITADDNEAVKCASENGHL